jgi:hypothetical protein
MPIELTAHTAAGARLVAIADALSAELAARAAEHDREGTYPFEAIDAHRAANPTTDGSAEEVGALFAEALAAKAFVDEAARPHRGPRARPLGRRWLPQREPPWRARSATSKPARFMHPLGANRAYDYLGRVAFGEGASLR